MSYWAYMLHCNAGRFYTGHTENLARRIGEHEAGSVPGYTRAYRPVALVWSQEFPTRDEALAAERRIKGWSRAKKLALIRSDWDEIARLAKKKNSPSTSSGRTDISPDPPIPDTVRAEPVEARLSTRNHLTDHAQP